MDEWEYFRIAVSYRDDGRVDFVAKKDKDPASLATHGGMKAQFNIAPKEWEAYLQNLRDEGWELVSVDKGDNGRTEAYLLKRRKV